METREKLIRTAERLMLRDGYSATRVDEVIRQAGLSKGSFYHFFESKEDLGLAALDHYFADRVKRLGDGAYAMETDPLERARGFLEFMSHVAADLWKEGCLLANLAADAAGSSPIVAGALRERTSELRARLEDLLSPFATPEASSSDLADQFLVSIEGAIVLARIYADPGYIERAVNQFRHCLEKTKGSASPAERPSPSHS